MEKIIWQLPFKQSNLTTKDWLHYKSKYHAFKDLDSWSLCNKKGFSKYHDKNFLEEIAKTCLNKINKMIEKEEREKPKYQIIIEASSFEKACALQLQIEEFEICGKINIINNKRG